MEGGTHFQLDAVSPKRLEERMYIVVHNLTRWTADGELSEDIATLMPGGHLEEGEEERAGLCSENNFDCVMAISFYVLLILLLIECCRGCIRD